MFKMSVDRGMIREVSLGKNVKVSTKVVTNSLGWEVQVYNEIDGWKKAPGTEIVKAKWIAEEMLAEMQKKALKNSLQFSENPVYRVYEALQFPVNIEV
jgi:hypothetical protein